MPLSVVFWARMRAVVQCVSRAKVTVSNALIGSIQKGFLVLLGVAPTDTDAIADAMIEKIVNLRIFDDSEGKMNLSLLDVKGSLLVVSQFTLYADCKKGRRPGFTDAAPPAFANEMYENFLKKCEAKGLTTQHGTFGAHMEVELVNAGPITIVLDSKELGF